MGAYDTMVAGLSGAGLALLGIITVHGTSEYHLNAAQMHDELRVSAETALADAGQNWAELTLKGQRATLTGSPPSVEAAEAARVAVLNSSGQGGILLGGIWSVDTQFSEIRPLPTASPYIWRAIKSPGGDIILVGSAPDENIKTALAAYASDLSGRAPDDRIELARGVPDGDWAEMARFGMEQLDLLDSGEARLTDYELRLSGIAMESTARIQATASVANLSDPWRGVPNIDGPSLWKAEHIDGTLVLSGSCETLEERAEIAEIAATYFDGPVVDQMTVSSSEHEQWIQGVRLGLPHFSQFENGEMEFQPEGQGFKFEGEATSSTLQFLREDMSQLESDYPVAIQAETVTVVLDEISDVDLGEDPLVACQTSFDLIMDANAVVFNLGSAEISRESGVTLDKINAVSEFCADNLMFEVGGHTDNSGDRAANITLSEARAQAVANYMAATGFDTARLIVQGYGPDQPKLDNATPEGRAANRRIEFKVQEWNE
ncbi:MAG: OmpA family protein [Alphaproteobacteria bacterium]|nr:OmpA family protein [Alphaproteobacteria bacterium]